MLDVKEIGMRLAGGLDPRISATVFKWLKAVPWVKRRLQEEMAGVMEEMEQKAKPYAEVTASQSHLPEEGRPRAELLREMARLRDLEESKWQDGYVSGAVYHGDAEHIDFLNRVYALSSQVNPLHSDVWPSASKYEAEVVSMTANMLGAERVGGDDQVCGVVSSGGTESILLAMKVYRDRARAERGITRPELIVPTTAHAAFDKAGQYFKIKLRRIPVDQRYVADVRAARRAISRNTIAIVGSTPSFPHGTIDPIEELSELARRRGIGFHTDACLGGFVLPWAAKLGYPVPPFDFSLPGVTSISVDTHKYGYAAKGTSVVLYRSPRLRRYQYYTTTEWPGGLYFSPTFAGSRPGALSAACWATLLSMGQQGYLEATKKILETAHRIKVGIREVPGLTILGDPLWNIAFSAHGLNIYQVMELMGRRGWSLNGLHKPAAVHLCLTLRHTQPGVADRFLTDLEAAVEEVRRSPQREEGMAPIYGMAATLPDRALVGEILERYIDLLYKV